MCPHEDQNRVINLEDQCGGRWECSSSALSSTVFILSMSLLERFA